jgi:2'-5' RNA ligase
MSLRADASGDSMFAHPSYRGREGLPQRQLTDRLFFAVFPNAGTAARIARLSEGLRVQHGLKGKPLATERFHVSLYHVGDYAGLPQDVVAAARDVASAVAMPAFTVAFNSAASFRGRPDNQPFVLRGDDGVVGLLALQQRLGTAMAKSGLGHSLPHYTPHVTLLYGDRVIDDRAIEPVGWPVHEFVLVHSLLGRSRYIPLARFPLRAQA